MDQATPYTPKEAATKLNVDIKTVYDAVKRGDIPSIRFGRLILIPRPAFDQLLKQGKAA